MMIRFFVEFVEGSAAQNLGLNPDGDFLLWDSEKEGDGNWHVWAKKNSERCLASPQNNIPPSGIMGIPVAVYDDRLNVLWDAPGTGRDTWFPIILILNSLERDEAIEALDQATRGGILTSGRGLDIVREILRENLSADYISASLRNLRKEKAPLPAATEQESANQITTFSIA